MIDAIKRARELVYEATGLPTEAEVSVSLKDGVRDRQRGLSPLESLHRHELGEVDAIRADVRVSWDAWYAVSEAAHEAGTGDVPRPEEQISMAISDLIGVSLEVQAANRARARGLRTEMTQALRPGATNTPPVDRFFVFLPVGFVLGVILAFASLPFVRALGLAEQDGQLEVAEAIGVVAGASIAAGIAFAGWWMFPPVELLDEGQVGRFGRFRGKSFAVLFALVVTVLGAFLYDAIRT